MKTQKGKAWATLIFKTSHMQKKNKRRLSILRILVRYYAVKVFFNQLSLRSSELEKEITFFSIRLLVAFHESHICETLWRVQHFSTCLTIKHCFFEKHLTRLVLCGIHIVRYRKEERHQSLWYLYWMRAIHINFRNQEENIVLGIVSRGNWRLE